MERQRSKSAAIEQLLSHTTSRTLPLTGEMAIDFEYAVEAEDAWFRQLASDYDELPAGPTGSERQNDRPAREWNDDELSACLLAYLEMLGKQDAKVGFSKADYRRTLLANELSRRTDGSIEYRMQNISAFLANQGKPTVDGYLPAKNVGRGVLERLQRIYDELGEIELTDFAPTEDPSTLSQRAAKLSRLTRQYIPVGNKNPRRSSVVQNQFIRDPLVVEAVLRFADGHCEYCGCEAPFRRDNGTLFLEVHHVRFLSAGGPDVVSNAAALCPNCHRACHHGSEREMIREQLIGRVARLENH